jgi:hypothetical protein
MTISFVHRSVSQESQIVTRINTTQHSTLQHNSAQHNTLIHTTHHNNTLHHTPHYTTIQHNTAQPTTTQHAMITHHTTTQHNTTQHSTAHRNTTTQHSTPQHNAQHTAQHDAIVHLVMSIAEAIMPYPSRPPPSPSQQYPDLPQKESSSRRMFGQRSKVPPRHRLDRHQKQVVESTTTPTPTPPPPPPPPPPPELASSTQSRVAATPAAEGHTHTHKQKQPPKKSSSSAHTSSSSSSSHRPSQVDLITHFIVRMQLLVLLSSVLSATYYLVGAGDPYVNRRHASQSKWVSLAVELLWNVTISSGAQLLLSAICQKEIRSTCRRLLILTTRRQTRHAAAVVVVTPPPPPPPPPACSTGRHRRRYETPPSTPPSPDGGVGVLPGLFTTVLRWWGRSITTTPPPLPTSHGEDARMHNHGPQETEPRNVNDASDPSIVVVVVAVDKGALDLPAHAIEDMEDGLAKPKTDNREDLDEVGYSHGLVGSSPPSASGAVKMDAGTNRDDDMQVDYTYNYNGRLHAVDGRHCTPPPPPSPPFLHRILPLFQKWRASSDAEGARGQRGDGWSAHPHTTGRSRETADGSSSSSSRVGHLEIGSRVAGIHSFSSSSFSNYSGRKDTCFFVSSLLLLSLSSSVVFVFFFFCFFLFFFCFCLFASVVSCWYCFKTGILLPKLV